MKVLIIAPFEKPEYTAHLIVRTFVGLGITPRLFSHREIQRDVGTERMNILLSEKLRDYHWGDLILIIKGDNIDPGVLEFTNARKALWHFDFDSVELPTHLIAIGIQGKAKVFLTCYPWVDELRQHGVDAFFLPQATDPAVYHPETPRPEYKCDIAFIGTNKPGRYEILQRLSRKFDCKVFGEGWTQPDCYPDKPAYLNEFNKVCASAKIVLNITPSKDWPIYERTFSQRIYMVLAAEGFLLTDLIPGLSQFFNIGNEVGCYHSLEYLEREVDWWLRRDSLREQIAHAGRQRILKEHTYYHRIGVLAKCLGLLLSVRNSSRA